MENKAFVVAINDEIFYVNAETHAVATNPMGEWTPLCRFKAEFQREILKSIADYECKHIDTSMEDCIMLVSMYGFPRFKEIVEFDGYDGETRYVRMVAEEFYNYINVIDWEKAVAECMTIYDYVEEFIANKVNELMTMKEIMSCVYHFN